MLLRRLGHRLGTATPQSPLAGIAPSDTSATLGSSTGATRRHVRASRARCSACAFDATSVVGEQRRTVAEVCSDIDFSLPAPDPADSCRARPWRPGLDASKQLALAFTGVGFDDAQDVGDRLLRHRLTASMLRVAAERPRRWRGSGRRRSPSRSPIGAASSRSARRGWRGAGAIRRADLAGARPDRQRRRAAAVQR